MRRFLAVWIAVTLCGAFAAAGAERGESGLTRFLLSRWGEMSPQTWEVVREDDGWWFRENDGWRFQEDESAPRPLPADLAAELEQIVADYDMRSWDGVYSNEYEVLDGDCFSLEMEFADGAAVSASGDNAFPEGYFEAMDAVDEFLERARLAALAGTYRYEGEGFGGDFTITLSADGTYTFSEGPLSSYAGMGEWAVDFGAVRMVEGETGFDLSFRFGVEADALIYLADGSDAFPGVSLSDGARFIRLDEAKDGAPTGE